MFGHKFLSEGGGLQEKGLLILGIVTQKVAQGKVALPAKF